MQDPIFPLGSKGKRSPRSAKEALMPCGKNHSGEIPKEIGDLPESQAEFWRHKCAGCAYLRGHRDGSAAEDQLRRRVQELEKRIQEIEGRA